MTRACVIGAILLGVACSNPPPHVAPPPTAPPVLVVTVADEPQPTLRLPRHFTAVSYAARLAIEPSKPTFGGDIAITGDLAKPASVIWLHGKDLAIRSAVARRDRETVPLAVTAKGEDLLEVRAARPLAAGRWILAIAYDGKVTMDAVAGAFHSSIGKDDYVMSNFEPTYARRVFPSLDEPDRKVPWQLTLDVPTGLVAVSNTPIARSAALDATHTRVEFVPTRPLPTYLIAFGVGPFEIVDGGKSKSGVPVRIVTPRGTADRAAYAASITPRLIDFLEAWFAIPYPYPKLDVVVAPAFDNDAMENSGAIFCDPTNSLVDKVHPSQASRHNIAMTIGHELAHQWFGDLVTPAWWDELWLNESFATWMEDKIIRGFDPGAHDEGLEVGVRSGAIHADAGTTARRIREPIVAPGGIIGAFDGITYNKGAAILRMVERTMGEEPFRRGIQAYVRAHADGTATAAGLIAALDTAAGKPIEPVISPLLDQAGIPELAVTLACDPEPHVTLAQHRFVPPGSPAPTTNPTWKLPICVVYPRAGKRAEACGLLDGPELALPLDGACPAWVMANADGVGYFYTAHTEKAAATLRDQAWPLLSGPERRVVFEDVRAQVLIGKLPIATLMAFVPKLLGGDRFAVGDALGGYGRFAPNDTTGLPFGIDQAIGPTLRPAVLRWIRDAIGARGRAAGFVRRDTDDYNTEVTSQVLVLAAVRARDPELLKQAVALAEHYRDLPHATRVLVLAAAVDASPALAARLHAAVFGEPDRELRGELLSALGHIHDRKRAFAELDLALDSRLEVGDIGALMFAWDDEDTRANTEAWMRQHVAALMKRLPPPNEGSVARYFGGMFTAACDPARRDEIATFVTATFGPILGADRIVKQQIEKMDQCIRQRAIVEPSVRAWLKVP